MKKSLILSAVVATLLFSGCDKAKDAANSVKEKTAEVATKASETTKNVASQTVQKATEATKEVANKAVETTKEVASKAVDSAKKTATAAVEKAKAAAAPAPKVDGKAIFTVCAGCHGQKAEKKALGTSKVIGGWDAAKIENALKGYKAGTYGGAMKGVMQGQAAKLDDAKIKAVAEYISTLK